VRGDPLAHTAARKKSVAVMCRSYVLKTKPEVLECASRCYQIT